MRGFNDMLGAADIGDQRVERLLHDQLDADRRCQVNHDVAFFDELVHELSIEN